MLHSLANETVGEVLSPRLREEIGGEVIQPADGGYEEARRLYITGFDQRPAAIVRPVDAAEVARVVRFASEQGMELAVRGGGHSLVGHSLSRGGLVLDLSAMRSIEVDPVARTAWAAAGVTAGEYTRTVGEHGLATGFGDAASVGVGGITLGGGIGFLHRAYGLTIDSLLAAEVVTADGQLLRADADSHPDLFWAIRGGGGNFGVVTRFHFRLHEVGDVLGGMLILPATPGILHRLVAELDAAPDELAGMLNVMLAPPMPIFPAELHGTPIIMAMLVHSGDVDAGARALAPIRAIATPILDQIQPIRYPMIYEGIGEPPHPAAMVAHPMFHDHFDLSAAEAVLEGLHRSTAPMSIAQFRPLGGAVARVPSDATAFPHRQRRMVVMIGAMFENANERTTHEHWAGALAESLSDGDRTAYINFLANDDPARVRDAYGEATWERLRSVKRRYDPTNFFRRNHNIPPA